MRARAAAVLSIGALASGAATAACFDLLHSTSDILSACQIDAATPGCATDGAADGMSPDAPVGGCHTGDYPACATPAAPDVRIECSDDGGAAPDAKAHGENCALWGQTCAPNASGAACGGNAGANAAGACTMSDPAAS